MLRLGEHADKVAAVQLLYVEPQARGDASAVKLLRAIRSWVAGAGASDLQLNVTTAIAPAKTDRFLRRMGFQQRGGGGYVLEGAGACSNYGSGNRSNSMNKKSHISLGNWNALVLATAAACSPASAQSINPTPLPSITTKRSPTMSLLDTPQELWSRILALLKKNSGFTTHQEVEETLGMKFTTVEKDDETRTPRLGAQFRYSMKEEVPGLGLVDIGLFEAPKKSHLGVSWGPDIWERPNCLNLSKVVGDIEALGWAPAEVRSNKPGRNGWNFYLSSVMAESARTGKPLRTYVDTSSVTLLMPNQFSQCVNGISINIWHP